jgi:D-lactate dehydrogenase (cytochrome)
MPKATYNLSPQNLQAAQKEMIELLGSERVSTNKAELIAKSSTQWSAAPRGELDRASVLVLPQTTEEVSAIAKICHKRRLPMIAFSGGTSLEGTLAVVTGGGVCIDFRMMNKVIAIHDQDMDVICQPGVGYEELNERLARQGLFFPPDPGPGAQIGGMVSQSCSGTNAYRYGTMKDWVLGLTIVLADGTIVKTRQRPRKSNAGYNLTQLMIGTEGTLGIVTEASLKLTRKPENEKVVVAAFPTNHKAVETAVKIVQNDIPIAAMELLDDVTMRAVNAAGYCDKEYPETPHLFFKFAGSKTIVQEQIERVKQFAKESQVQSFQLSQTKDEAEALWAARKTALWSILAMKENPSDEFLSADAAVPVSRLADIVEDTHKRVAASGMIGACMGHVGDGNFHLGLLYSPRDRERARNIISEVQKKAIEMDGTITGEHGIGLEFRDILTHENGVTYIDAMRQIKLALDPLCLLNPDKVFRISYEVVTN